MEEMSLILQVLTYIFTIVLLIVGIIAGIRIIRLSDKADKVLDELRDKVNSLNGAFNVVNRFSSSIDLVSSKIIGVVTNFIGKVLKKKKEDIDDE